MVAILKDKEDRVHLVEVGDKEVGAEQWAKHGHTLIAMADVADLKNKDSVVNYADFLYEEPVKAVEEVAPASIDYFEEEELNYGNPITAVDWNTLSDANKNGKKKK